MDAREGGGETWILEAVSELLDDGDGLADDAADAGGMAEEAEKNVAGGVFEGTPEKSISSEQRRSAV